MILAGYASLCQSGRALVSGFTQPVSHFLKARGSDESFGAG
jgi:hypothetical protein